MSQEQNNVPRNQLVLSGTDQPDPCMKPLSTPRLTGQQQTLLDELKRMGGNELSDIYVGTLRVLQDESNPNRYALAAHSVREIANRIPRSLGVSVEALKQSVGDQVCVLHGRWVQATQRSGCHSGGLWTGTIDRRLSSFLKRVGEFFDWHTKHRPKRKTEQKRVLRTLDASGLGVPVPLEDLNVEIWQEMISYFVRVCHGGSHGSANEFDTWLDSFEKFLLDRVRPRTFDDQDAIDQLIGRKA